MPVGTEGVFSKTLLAGVASTFFSGVALAALTRSTSCCCCFLAWVDSERRPAAVDMGSAVALTVERRPLPLITGLLMLLGAGPMELLRLRFREEFSLPERRHNAC